jgi:hypothetical protein
MAARPARTPRPERGLMIASTRYLHTFAKHDGTWLFSQRKLIVDWTETRTIAAS